MADTQKQSWSDNPNAPRISPTVYFEERASFAGMLIASMLYGILIVVFFQCMAALLNPVSRERRGIKWGPVSYTVVMFSLGTVYTATKLNVQSVSFIDNREFPGLDDLLPPGPLGYLWSNSRALCTVPNLMFLLSNWLADGLMLYRCYVVYSMNLWVIVAPCLVYLATVATGILFLYRTWIPSGIDWETFNIRFSIPYFSISLSLNVLLTLMIIIRLVLHSRSTRTTATALAGIGGLYRTVITMLIESCALYAVSSLLVIGTYLSGNCSADVFLPILAETQVIAPLLIIKQVANRNASKNNIVTTENFSSFKAGGQRESRGSGSTLHSAYPTDSVDKYGESSSELRVEVETTIDFHRDSKV